jgi:oxalate decarboxylase/phosphoglucose isomerase-like protein (cupin superfamily)
MALPRKSTLFKNIQRDADERGGILSIVDEPVQNVSIITCTPGALRSNHYHHSDFHFMYVLEGEIDYFYKDVDTGEIQYLKVREGDNIFTPDNELHATYFPKTTVMVVSSKFSRDQETYEKDTVRVPFVTQDNIQEMLAKYADNG